MNDGVLCHNAIFRGVNFDHFELDLSHTGSDRKEISLSDGPVGFAEVGSEEDIEERPGQTLNGICDRKDSDAFRIFDVRTRVDSDDIAVLPMKGIRIPPSSALLNLAMRRQQQTTTFVLYIDRFL
ncbi:hypothetical protein PHISCL_10765, partial [Aspergillus sclerotialis]